MIPGNTCGVDSKEGSVMPPHDVSSLPQNLSCDINAMYMNDVCCMFGQSWCIGKHLMDNKKWPFNCK